MIDCDKFQCHFHFRRSGDKAAVIHEAAHSPNFARLKGIKQTPPAFSLLVPQATVFHSIACLELKSNLTYSSFCNFGTVEHMLLTAIACCLDVLAICLDTCTDTAWIRREFNNLNIFCDFWAALELHREISGRRLQFLNSEKLLTLLNLNQILAR